MAATGYTPISLYYSTTAAAVPVNTNLANGELAINITDGKIYYEDNTGTVQLFGSKSDLTSISFGTTGLTPATATGGAVTVAGTLVAANGGTGQSSYTAGDLLYASGTTALSKLGIGTAGQALIVSGGTIAWGSAGSIANALTIATTGGAAGVTAAGAAG